MPLVVPPGAAPEGARTLGLLEAPSVWRKPPRAFVRSGLDL